MQGHTAASREIDQTLRLARDAVERDIASYRLVFFAVATLLTSAIRLLGGTLTWVPTLCFATSLAYAGVIWLYLARVGNPPALAALSLSVDLLLLVATFHVSRYFGTPTDQPQTLPFLTNIVGPVLVLALLLNTLRNSVALSLAGGAAALTLYLWTVLTLTTFHPAHIAVASVLGLAGVIGAASARQARKNLDTFARLQLLRRYLPPEAVLRVMREDPDAALAPGGQLVTVTLLAADLRGFTAMSEDVSPSEVMSQLNAYHGAMINVIETHGGAIDKFIGDGTLVVFGMTGSKEAAATAAVECAGAMIDALGVHNRERAERGAMPLAMGIGVHTGPVIAGNLGIPGKRLEFTVIGDTVNTVSRLEGQTKGSGSPVIISAETAALLANKAPLRELTPVSLRGKAHAMAVYGLTRHPTIAAPAPSGPTL